MKTKTNVHRTLYLLFIGCFITLILLSSSLYAQVPTKQDTIVPSKGNVKGQLDSIKQKKIEEHHDSTGSNQPKRIIPVDTTKENKYADLLRDDTAYNKRYSLWRPAVEVFGANAALLSLDRYVFKYDFSTSVGISSWKYNINTGWEWDDDRFGINFIGHPYTGDAYFNAGRANGYNFFQSCGFAVEGSLMWEYFGENTRPSYNDLIYTSFDGAFLGEILYRISSNVLDDRTSGRERVFREILAGIIDPMRGFNRLVQGKTFRRTNKEVYQKDRLNFTIFAGAHKINDQYNTFLSGQTSEILNLQIDYGNPFEVRNRQPFDFFKVKVETNIGVGRKIIDNVTGYGILFGKNMSVGKLTMLTGGFLYYDYWDNHAFELATIGVGGGITSELPLTKTSFLYTNLHLAAVPLSGNSTGTVTDTSQSRDYSYGYGWEGKLEASLVLGKIATVGVSYYYYMIHLFNNKGSDESPMGTLGDNYISTLKPKVTFHIYKSVSIGFEQTVYYQNHNRSNYSIFNSTKTEQRIFLVFFFEDKQRKGHYN